MPEQETRVVLNHDFMRELLRHEPWSHSNEADLPCRLLRKVVEVCTHSIVVNKDVQAGYRRAIPQGGVVILQPLQRLTAKLNEMKRANKLRDTRKRFRETIPGLPQRHQKIVLGAIRAKARYLISSNWEPDEELSRPLRKQYGLQVVSPAQYVQILERPQRRR